MGGKLQCLQDWLIVIAVAGLFLSMLGFSVGIIFLPLKQAFGIGLSIFTLASLIDVAILWAIAKLS